MARVSYKLINMQKYIKNNHLLVIMLVNRTKLKEICGNLSVTQDFYQELERSVEELVKKACKRAVANNRRTVMARDI